MSGAANGTSRRAFLGRAAGAAAAVAGAGVGAGAIAQSAAAADKRSYTSGRFALELDGVACGKFGGLDGGDRCGNVVLDPPTPGDTVQHKHISGVKWEAFTLQVGSGMGKPMYEWIKQSFDKGYVRKNGAIRSADFNYNEKSRASVRNAFISEVTVPALDRTSTEPLYIAVDVTAEQVTKSPGSGGAILGQKQKAWLPANFVFEVEGVDTSRVAKIDSFTWKCSIASDGSALCDVSDIGVTFPHADMSSWRDWCSNSIRVGGEDRAGALTIIGANGGAVITFSFSNLGIYRLIGVPRGGDAGNLGRVRAEMYCESMRVLPTVNK